MNEASLDERIDGCESLEYGVEEVQIQVGEATT